MRLYPRFRQGQLRPAGRPQSISLAQQGNLLQAEFISAEDSNPWGPMVFPRASHGRGGMRASIYNAMPVEGVEKLCDFIKRFDREN